MFNYMEWYATLLLQGCRSAIIMQNCTQSRHPYELWSECSNVLGENTSMYVTKRNTGHPPTPLETNFYITTKIRTNEAISCVIWNVSSAHSQVVHAEKLSEDHPSEHTNKASSPHDGAPPVGSNNSTLSTVSVCTEKDSTGSSVGSEDHTISEYEIVRQVLYSCRENIVIVLEIFRQVLSLF